jgi:adenosine deaminase
MTSPAMSLPKAELHLHIEGTLEPELAFELAARNGVQLPYADVAELRARYRFEDLQSFLDLYYACMTVLRTRQDFADLALAYLEKANSQGVRHVEMFFDPQVHTGNGVAIDAVLDGLGDALAIAKERWGITGGLILCFLRDQPVDSAMATLDSVAHRAADLIGVGLDSAEVGYPPSLFTAVYQRARELGLHTVAHAGEEGPAEYIVEALDQLRAERIDHGVRCLEDAAVVARLREERIPLTVCPFSNVRLGGVPDLAQHPLPAMLEAGLLVTINSDDPAYFGGYAGDNMQGVAEAFGLGTETLALLADNSVEASFADDTRKGELRAELAEWRSQQ